MMAWLYVTQSVPWIAAGLLVGFFVGRSTVAVETIVDAVQHEVTGMSGTDRNETAPHKWRITATSVLGVVVVVLGISTAVQAYVQGEATSRLTNCQQVYANGFADALDARSKSAAEAQDALDTLLSTVAAITPTPEGRAEFAAALRGYLSKRAEAKETQREHPYPPAPRDVCRDSG